VPAEPSQNANSWADTARDAAHTRGLNATDLQPLRVHGSGIFLIRPDDIVARVTPRTRTYEARARHATATPVAGRPDVQTRVEHPAVATARCRGAPIRRCDGCRSREQGGDADVVGLDQASDERSHRAQEYLTDYENRGDRAKNALRPR
jgi:hypothetical protein